ncbi:uncharacterized protein CCOS01_15270 [Colletotrichum costaricense]|uniref:Uncharacterized protein n=1 Tax=Colletotrichum costaricense TaxID=1209916 RepID=A0AAI9YHK8_9PEZI|nr:uncharacterized protein CCOS01_15270 [Colletotrichum costaricense]KAK1510439.1 hypothetical protein CCOS01_15270 [Colletotrichum costaricense]
MEVSSENFWRQLPNILLSIAKSDFVAIDLEMTGITDKSSADHSENPTNQQIYESAKKIASKFNVFEMGMTCIQSQSDGSYKTETYSFTVSPYLHTETRADEKFVKGLDRSLSVSYNTLKFLRSEGIRLEKVYEDCVPYLSREEARLAVRQMQRRQDPWDAKDHGYNEDDEGLTTFSIYAHNTIVNWLYTDPWMRTLEINVLLPNSDSKKRMSVYEQIVRRKARKLVPRMVCRLWNHGTTVVISQRDDGQESKRRESLEDDLNASLRKYAGIRLIIEALVGGKFANLINPDLIVEAMSGWPGEAQCFCREVHELVHPAAPEQWEESPEEEVEDRFCPWCCTHHDPDTGCSSTSSGQDVEVAFQTNLITKDECLCMKKRNLSRSRVGDNELMPLVYDVHCERCYPDLGSSRPGINSSPHHDIPPQATHIQEAHSASHDGESSSSSEGVAGGEFREGDTGTWHITAETAGWDEPTGWNKMCHDLEDLSTETLKNEVADALQELETLGRTSSPTIIGHNQFMDLLFLYNTFIDDLPDSFLEFLVNIHQLFPRIVDTKLLAIKDDTIEGEDPLMDLYNRFDGNRTQPSIHWDAAYGYGRRETAHQAGFDSHMTAVVFLRIAHKLAREESARLEGRAASYESKEWRLYDREWLSAVGYDSQFLGYSQDSDIGTWRESNTQEGYVGRIRWQMAIFDDIRDRIRIAPRKTFNIGPEW